MKIATNIALEFDAFSANYTEDMINCVPFYEKLLRSFTKTLPVGFVPQRILDLGCGNGNVTAQLLHAFPESHFELLDASQQMIDLCKNRFLGKSINYHPTFFNEFPFPESEFDLITAGFSIHHCNTEEKKALFKKIYNSLKPNGVFGICDLMIDKNSNEHPKLLEDWKLFVSKNYPDDEKWKWLMEHYNAFDKPDALQNQLLWLQEVGFTSIEPTVYDQYWVYIRAIKP
ncbi:MAG: class I SAM-dependent methyltransferase [Flavobacteriaceae bacterium]